MATPQPNLLDVDWSQIPAPEDDGGARHLTGASVPDIALPSTDGGMVSLASLRGRSVVFAYPRTGQPGKIALVETRVPAIIPGFGVIWFEFYRLAAIGDGLVKIAFQITHHAAIIPGHCEFRV